MAKKILIVGDDRDVLAYLTDLFGGSGYRTCSAGNSAEALEVVQREKPDLVILSMDTPEKGGAGFSMRFRKEPAFKGIPVIVVSGIKIRPPEPRKQIAILDKPINPARALKAVREMLDE